MKAVFTRMMMALALLATAPVEAKMVTLAEVTQGEAGASIWVSGTVASRQQAALSAEVSGRVEWIAEFGSRVKAGDELLRLDAATLYLSLEQSRAEQGREASNLRYARAEFQRLERLHQQKSASQSQYDKARYEVEQAELAEQLARVQVRQIEAQLQRTHIFAPFDGVVNEHFIQPGEHVDAGERALELVNPAQPDIRLRAPIVWASQLEAKARLRVEGDQLSGHAVYYQRAASADPKSRLIELRLRPEPGRFIIGSPVRVALPLGEQQTMLLPRDALVLGTEGSVVYQVEQAELADQLARVQVRQIEAQLQRTRIFAPFDGVVNEHFIQPGEHVDAGEQALELVNPDQPDIRLRAPIVWASQLEAKARLRVEGEQLSGHAVYYQRAASADPKSRLIELRLRPEQGRFIIGSPVRVALPLGEQQTMLLPRDALVLGTEGSVVYQVEQRGEALTVNRVPVTVLFGDNQQVAVSGALKQGDRVVVRGAGSLQDGDKVELFRG